MSKEKIFQKNEDGSFTVDADAAERLWLDHQIVTQIDESGLADDLHLKELRRELSKTPEQKQDEAFRARYNELNRSQRQEVMRRIKRGMSAFADSPDEVIAAD